MITSFSGEHRFLSNFWPSRVKLDNEWYPTVEHAYQAAKSLDPNTRKRIQCAGSAGQAKRLGRTCAVRPDWEEIKTAVMLDLLRKKFSDLELAKKLVATGDQYLIEGNTWGDRYWGAVQKDGIWVGSNLLGILLMVVRDDIKTR